MYRSMQQLELKGPKLYKDFLYAHQTICARNQIQSLDFKETRSWTVLSQRS